MSSFAEWPQVALFRHDRGDFLTARRHAHWRPPNTSSAPIRADANFAKSKPVVPSWPFRLLPQAQSSPFPVTTTICFAPVQRSACQQRWHVPVLPVVVAQGQSKAPGPDTALGPHCYAVQRTCRHHGDVRIPFEALYRHQRQHCERTHKLPSPPSFLQTTPCLAASVSTWSPNHHGKAGHLLQPPTTERPL